MDPQHVPQSGNGSARSDASCNRSRGRGFGRRTTTETAGIVGPAVVALLLLYVLSIAPVVRMLHHLDVPVPGGEVLISNGGHPVQALLGWQVAKQLQGVCSWLYTPLFYACHKVPQLKICLQIYLALWGITVGVP